MRVGSSVLIGVMLVVVAGFAPVASAQTSSNAQFESAGTDTARVQAFLGTLQDALAMENHLKVASMVKYPLEAWVDGQAITLRNDGALLSRYRQIFDPSLRRLIADLRVEAMTASADGISIDGGRICLKAGDKGRGLKIVKFGDPVTTR